MQDLSSIITDARETVVCSHEENPLPTHRYNKNLIQFMCYFKRWSFTQHLLAAEQGCSLWLAADTPFEVLQPER